MPPPARPIQGKVRWRRFAVMLVPSVIVAALLIGLTATGVLAASISVSGTPFIVTASTLQGTGFSQYGSAVTPAGGHQTPVVVSVMHSADLSHLCQSVTALGVTLRLTAGDGAKAAHADNLVVAADELRGDATFNGIVIGQNADTLPYTNGAFPPRLAPNGFGQTAGSVTINNLYQHTWLTTAGTFSLPGLQLGFGDAC